MIDYVKIYLEKIDLKRLIFSTGLDFNGGLSKTTGEINETVLVAHYHFCKITIYNAKSQNPHVLFTGSIHKLWNDLNGIKAPNYNPNKPYKGFNGNQFTINDIVEVRTYLETLFDCKASQMIFQNIEFGVNAIIDFNPYHYLKGLLYHKNILFEFSHYGNNAQVQHQNTIFKIYNKSYQFKMNENVLRVELKIMKMIELKFLDIRTFSDIDEIILANVQKMLLKRFDEVMHYDYSIDKKKLTKRELEAIKSYSNPRYWIEDLKPIHRDRHKKKLGKITQLYSKQLHQKIKTEILEKCVMINQLSQKAKCVTVNRSSIVINITQKQPYNSLTLNSILVQG
ncbi:hypothetical protein [Flavobacterium wongokense]|uniref:hypothetical protein n=1 Tax=Flavobacterium wongokense TaxID=2910674 RepID=UPI001F48E0F0|nr:hypothetical protein [Flavobacterium sp. WG47]MCF6131104.1 hypothetical protein [Flavobacterium sp. WG47]